MGYCDKCLAFGSVLESDLQAESNFLRSLPAASSNVHKLEKELHLHLGDAHEYTDKPVKFHLHNHAELKGSADRGCQLCQFFLDIFVACGKSDFPAEQPIFLEKHFSGTSTWHLVAKPPEKYWDEMISNPNEDYWLKEFPHIALDLCNASAKTSQSGTGENFTISSDPSADSCFELISDWLRICRAEHDCGRSESSADEMISLPTRVLEIPADPGSSPRLRITKGAKGRYLTLSHCWGDVGMTKLTSDCLQQYQEAIDPTTLSQNFQDAIYITRRLGFHYLWIDALCIIQNDIQDWNEEAPKMASIYAHTSLMISADAAPNTQYGLLKPRRIRHSTLIPDTHLCFRLQICRVQNQPQGPLSSRGWVAQERMLAPRVLHYQEDEMIWECARGWYMEGRQTGKDNGYKGRFECEEKHHLDTGSDSNLSPLVPYAWQGTLAKEPLKKPVHSYLTMDPLQLEKTWFNFLEDYSLRSLSYSSDKLPAIAGVAEIFGEKAILGQYLAGLWTHDIGRHLAWEGPFIRTSGYRAPSWSWAAYDGPTVNSSYYGQSSYFGPKLVEHGMRFKTSNEYMEVLPGSFIVLEGSCFDTNSFFNEGHEGTLLWVEILLDDGSLYWGNLQIHVPWSKHTKSKTRRKNGPTGPTEPPNLDTSQYENMLYSGLLGEQILCMQLDWRSTGVKGILLKPTSEERTSYERIGLLEISFPDADYKVGDIALEKRTVKLV